MKCAGSPNYLNGAGDVYVFEIEPEPEVRARKGNPHLDQLIYRHVERMGPH